MHEKLYSYFCVQSSKYTIHVKVYFKYFSNTFRGNIDPSPKIFFPGSFFSRQLRCYDLEFRIKDQLLRKFMKQKHLKIPICNPVLERIKTFSAFFLFQPAFNSQISKKISPLDLNLTIIILQQIFECIYTPSKLENIGKG